MHPSIPFVLRMQLPPPSFGCPLGHLKEGRGQRPWALRPVLTLVRPVSEKGVANPSTRRARVLRTNFGVSHHTASRGPGSSKMVTISGGYKCTLECPTPEQSDLPHPPSPLPFCGAPTAARAEPEGRAAAGTGSLPPGARRMAQLD